jgi:hypothetical protein
MNLGLGWKVFKKYIFEAFIFFQVHSMTMHIILILYTTALQCINFQKPHTGGIRTWGLLFWRRTRWPQWHTTRALGLKKFPW